MNLTEEVKLSIKNEIKKHGLNDDDSLFDQVVSLMEKKKQSYQAIIADLANAYKQQKTTVSNNFAFNSVGANSFKERLESTSKAVTNQILQSLIEAEQEAYQRYFSGNFDASMFPTEIAGHSVTSNLKALNEA